MSVSNYNPQEEYGCRYNYDKLKHVVYLISKSHAKNVHIDEGAAYITDLSEVPVRLKGFNIQFSEESSLDERYKFTKKVNISLHGYASLSSLDEKYYVILESEDGTFWMVNPDFPSKVTYEYNLSEGINQTDFVFSIQSNFPTLKINLSMASIDAECYNYRVKGIESLRMLENGLCGLDEETKTLYTYGEPFKIVKYLKDSCSLKEEFDGEKATVSIEFNIGLDAYKSSWHYNLLEFLENLYAAVVIPKGQDNAFYCGFNFGLQPNFTIEATDTNNTSDIITVRLVETSNHGLVAALDYDEHSDTSTTWSYVSRVGDIKTYECVGDGVAKYLVQAEFNAKGYPTGNYKALTGYSFPSLNIVGYFDDVVTFPNDACTDACSLTTNMPPTITYTDVSCRNYTLQSSCDWHITNKPDYINITPSFGSPNVVYDITVCNTQPVTETVTSSFSIAYGSKYKTINVLLTQSANILSPSEASITCLAQNVSFIYNQNCPITVTSIDSSLSYQITNNQLIVTVPRNYTANIITWDITVKDCNNNTQTVYIYQNKTFENWVETSGYLCVDGNSYKKEERYTGTTSTNINTPTGEFRAGDLIQTSDSRCSSYQTRWSFLNHYYCVDGDKYKALEEQISYDGGTTWTETGNTKLGDLVEADSSWCDLPVTYSWRQSIKWQCSSD